MLDGYSSFLHVSSLGGESGKNRLINVRFLSEFI